MMREEILKKCVDFLKEERTTMIDLANLTTEEQVAKVALVITGTLISTDLECYEWSLNEKKALEVWEEVEKIVNNKFRACISTHCEIDSKGKLIEESKSTIAILILY